ncbi:MAG: hypothetical protein WCJ19_05755 [bacterium]
MSSKTAKTIKQLLKDNVTDTKTLEYIIDNFKSLNLSKTQVRKIINIFEKKVMKDYGVIDRDMSTEVKENIKKAFNLKGLVVKEHNGKNIGQTLKVGDIMYSYDVHNKIKDLK